MGTSSSKLEKALAESSGDGEERYFGLENFGNTCYCNSVLQALMFCRPFRERLLRYHEAIEELPSSERPPESLLTCLADLVAQIASSKKRTGVIAPRKFVHRLKRDNELFSGYMHQDAHEFVNYLLNELAELLEKQEKAARERRGGGGAAGAQAPSPGGGADADEPAAPKTFIHELFEGVLTNETRCMFCESVTSRDESFLDLSIDIDADSSVTACLKSFSKTETLSGDEKFCCDTCCTYQEAQKRLRIKKTPQVLCLHLKRFKFIESLGRMKKLSHRVVFPNELRLFNTAVNAEGAEAGYSLFAVVVHIGSGPNHGHYVCLVESQGRWLLFDDESVEIVDEDALEQYYGASGDNVPGNSEHGYLLFYTRDEGPAPTSTAPVVSEPFGRCTTSSAMSSLNAGTKLDPEEAGAEDARKLLLSKFSTVGLGNTL